ncbi:hypothetical protein ACPX19_10475 [Winogradskyella sp. HB-48]|uniref:hypothetical protein n=1 Tax=Winogradskyella sp. HB-48 TaxID=3416808 RepID=UPI003CEA5132
MKSTNIILTTFIILFLFSCKSNDEKEKNNKQRGNEYQSNRAISNENLNISLLLDLSDRISPDLHPNPSMQIYERDINYIKSVSNAFLTHLRSKKVRQMNDKIQLYFEPEPSNQNINRISEQLKFEVTRQNASLDKLEKINQMYESIPKEIYNLAIKDNNYVGSDTWSFIKEKVDDYCIDEDYRNILVILSDGYIYHEEGKIKKNNMSTYITTKYFDQQGLKGSNWEDKYNNQKYGLIQAHGDLSNLEILVLGINPNTSGNPYELDIIRKFWTDWFDKMNVARYEIKTADLPSNLDNIIQNFILNI